MKAIRTRFYGPTDTRGSRIVADDGDGNRISESYDHALNSDDNHMGVAYLLMHKMNWSGQLVGAWYKNDCYWVTVIG